MTKRMSFALAEPPRDLSRLLRDPRCVWMRRAAGQMHASTTDFDEEQHVQSLQPDGVHREEIDRHDALGLSPQKVAPGQPRSVTGRAKMVRAQNLADGRRRYPDAEPFQFAHNPLIAPTRILPREPHNEVADLTTNGPSANSVTISPTPSNQPTMPFEQGGRLDDKRRRARARQESACGRQEHAVRRSERRPTDLATQDGHLVPEHHAFRFLEFT
jgi:hypothetical protein